MIWYQVLEYNLKLSTFQQIQFLTLIKRSFLYYFSIIAQYNNNNIIKKLAKIMCIDDYQFRHFSSRKNKVCRKFIVVNQEQFSRTYYLNISQFEEFGNVALCKIFLHLSNRGLVIENKKFYIPKFKAIVKPFSNCIIRFDALDERDIFIRQYPIDKDDDIIFSENELLDKNYSVQEENYYCRFEEAEELKDLCQMMMADHAERSNQFYKENNTNQSTFQSMQEEAYGKVEREKEEHQSSENTKKSKECQRIIGQVIKAVKIWRGLYESKRCNLTVAAKIVGISKKSLDDYYLGLRIGEILNFDYKSNLDKRMGYLRNYIRSCELKITGKLTKTVKCFALVPDVDIDQLIQNQKMEQEP